MLAKWGGFWVAQVRVNSSEMLLTNLADSPSKCNEQLSGRFVPNHRYLTEKVDVAAVVAQSWRRVGAGLIKRGQVMHVPL